MSQDEIIQNEFERYRILSIEYQNTPHEQKYTYKMQAIRDLIKLLSYNK